MERTRRRGTGGSLTRKFHLLTKRGGEGRNHFPKVQLRAPEKGGFREQIKLGKIGKENFNRGGPFPLYYLKREGGKKLRGAIRTKGSLKNRHDWGGRIT